ncbi:hypothetical protein C0Z18_08565 [Trinickia dabaoshanensis]|uniref:DUF3068 domain-containing protein n=2 Tax=Trinickia dabaoshanensis TaxID=564714 RepID=A0A2N7VVP2_9BURK|nr:hypothetical protein C0Z18_08565 [Trinickia dabaoshanensis]
MITNDVSVRSAGCSLLFLCCLLFGSAAHSATHPAPHARAAAPSASSASLLVPADTSIPSDVWNDPRWQQGPMTARLGKVATLVVPPGYRYLPPLQAGADESASDAGETDYAASDQSSDSLSAVIAPEDGSWTTRIAVAYTAHIDTSDLYLDPDDLARTMQVRSSPFNPLSPASAQSLPDLVEIKWIRAPRWDGARHKLDWLYENKTTGARGVDDTSFLNAAVLGRRYTVAIQTELDGAGSSERAAALQTTFDKLVSGVRFRDMERYGAYQSGEPTAKLKLTDYITGPETDDEKAFDDKVAHAIGFDWRGLGLRVLPLMGLAALVWGRAQRKKQTRRDEAVM